MDYLNDYGIRPFLPISNHSYMASIIFIIDIWFWLMLGGYVYLTIELKKYLKIIFTILSILSLVLLFAFPELPLLPKILYLLGIISIYFFRSKWGQVNNKKFSVFIFSAFFAYIGLSFILRDMAEKNFINYQKVVIKKSIEKYHITPLPLSFFEWQFIAKTNDKIFIGTTNSTNNNLKITETIQTNLSKDYAKKALKTETGKVMANFAEFLFSYKKEDKEYIYIYLRDAKYLRAGENSFATRIIKFKK